MFILLINNKTCALQNPVQSNVEFEVAIGRDFGSRSFLSITQFARYHQLTGALGLHSQEALVPTLDHVPSPNSENK